MWPEFFIYLIVFFCFFWGVGVGVGGGGWVESDFDLFVKVRYGPSHIKCPGGLGYGGHLWQIMHAKSLLPVGNHITPVALLMTKCFLFYESSML